MNEELKNKLTDLGLNDEQVGKLEGQGVTSEADMALLTAQEIRDVTGCGIVPAKKVAVAFVPAPEPGPATVTAPVGGAVTLSVLPAVPDGEALLEMMRAGGILKPSTVDVVSAVRAAIGTWFGVFDLPDRIMTRMEQFAREQDEPVGASFYELQKLVTTRNYADVLSAMGVGGHFMNEARKRELISRVDTMFWPALRNFHSQLVGWQKNWLENSASPAAMNMTILAIAGRGGMLPPGMMEPPPTGAVRDAAEDLINNVNKIFAGTGIPVARAMAYDATRIRSILEDPALPTALGATSREHMMKMLGVDTSAGDVRMEKDVTQYTLSVMKLPEVGSGNDELLYLSALLQLGGTILWDKLGEASGSVKAVPKEDKPMSAAGFRSGERSSTSF